MKLLFSISVLFLVSACGTAKKLVYIDDWDGNYLLNEHNCCGSFQKAITLVVRKKEANLYNWYMLREGERFAEGKATYAKKKLKFYVQQLKQDKRYFVSDVSENEAVFWMEYDNYYSDKDYRYIGCYTRWNNELIGFEQSNKLFAGVHFHFKKVGSGKIMLKRNEPSKG